MSHFATRSGLAGIFVFFFVLIPHAPAADCGVASDLPFRTVEQARALACACESYEALTVVLDQLDRAILTAQDPECRFDFDYLANREIRPTIIRKALYEELHLDRGDLQSFCYLR